MPVAKAANSLTAMVATKDLEFLLYWKNFLILLEWLGAAVSKATKAFAATVLTSNYKRVTLHKEFIFFDFGQWDTDALLQGLKQLPIEQRIVFQEVIDFYLSKSVHLPVKSSGSTGPPKVIQFSKTAWDSSVAAFKKAFKIEHPISIIHCLPLEFVAGKMLLYRAISLGWKMYYTLPTKGVLKYYPSQVDMIALTPYQLLEDIQYLNKVSWVLLGGAQLPLELIEPLRHVETPVYQTFAMTETLTNFAMRKVNQVAEKWPAYEVFPEVQIQVNDENCLLVDFPEVTHGFLQTNDIVELVSPNLFYWLGRKDFVVNSGGVKIIVEELEEQLKPYVDFPFFLLGVPHSSLGQELVLVIEANEEQAKNFPFFNLKSQLPPLKAPRALFATPKFENTLNYKINRKASFEKSVKIF